MSYLGSKGASGAYQTIIANMPPHDTYIETHLGSGIVMANKPPAAQSIGIDMDPAAIKAYKQNHPLTTVKLYRADAHLWLKHHGWTNDGQAFIYCDPPYLLSTRTSRHRYTFEYDEADHVELLGLLMSLTEKGIRVMVSGYQSALYDDMLSTWRAIEYQAMTRGGVRTEKLWMNYPPDLANWIDYAGENFTDRQRIKRKAERWRANYLKLPAGERLAILAAMTRP